MGISGVKPNMAAGRGPFVWVSVAGHLAVGTALVLVPIFWPAELPPPEGVRAVLLGPAPPPPPPLSFGSREAKPKPERATRHAKQRPKPVDDSTAVTPLTVPETVEPMPAAEPISAEEPAPSIEVAGSLEGTVGGSPNGVIDGVDGGVVGGVRDGRVGGDPLGTGTEVVAYDIAPRVLRQPRPVYPAEAAVKRIEGTVVVDVWIGRDGRVVDARVVQSVQLLDQEALRTVYSWEFAPAKKRGVAVPSVARAEVKFTLL
jgi:periplasmic protein TonB